jgi:hypothetical protein
VYKEVVAPERLVNTESWGGDWPETLNTLTLSEQGGKTTINLRILYPSKEARDAALKTGMKDGMTVSFDRFAEYLPTNRVSLRSHCRRGHRLTSAERVTVVHHVGAVPPQSAQLLRQ